MPEWKKNKNPLHSSPKYVSEMSEFKNSVVLIDIRPEAEIKVAHIDGAVAVDAGSLASMQAKFPAKKEAPIVIVASDAPAARKAFDTIRGWGYKNASILKGGLTGWQQAGFSTVAGDADADIVYVPKPIPGAMTADEFRTLLAGKSADTLIIDVRTEDEASTGAIKGALNIPTDEVADRIAEIPKDKSIITYCSTGIRAEMAYITLKEKGYKAKFLNAKAEFADGKLTVTEN